MTLLRYIGIFPWLTGVSNETLTSFTQALYEWYLLFELDIWVFLYKRISYAHTSGKTLEVIFIFINLFWGGGSIVICAQHFMQWNLHQQLLGTVTTIHNKEL